ncbi:MAG: V-type ATP synthase subunit I [Alphaproteobacteria bacterium]|nr:V-type ATP synthase subunit I [Alphaproteobacteria bacterium]
MSIVKLKKVDMVALREDRAALLQSLQDIGRVHVVPLRPDEAGMFDRTVSADTLKAWSYISRSKGKRKHQVRDESLFDEKQVTTEALANQEKLLAIRDRIAFLRNRIKEVKPWGDFTMPPPEELAGLRLWFYKVPHGKRKAFTKAGYCHEVVHTCKKYAYVVIVAKDEPRNRDLPVQRATIGRKPLSELYRDLEQAKVELDMLEAERQSLTRWAYLLQKTIARHQDDAARTRVERESYADDQLFALRAWAAADQVKELKSLTDRFDMMMEISEPEPEDTPPTLLKNTEFWAPGEDLVNFYQTPAYRSWDPSSILLFSFAIFFALIVSDAGYALLLALAVILFWRKLGRSKTGLRVRRIGILLSISSAVYGVLIGSYFGLEPPTPALKRLDILDMNDYTAMQNLTISIGIIHVMVANLVHAWQLRGTWNMLSPFGWLVTLLGASLIWAGFGDRTGDIYQTGIATLAGGLTLVFLFTSQRRIENLKSLLMRMADGFLALTGVSKAFGDVLSYLRLFALGLASAALALTFNDLAGQVRVAVPEFGAVLAIVILVLGHGLNFLLALVSGVIHGLRLNMIEFFGWSLRDEGKPFITFEKKEKYVNG